MNNQKDLMKKIKKNAERSGAKIVIFSFPAEPTGIYEDPMG